MEPRRIIVTGATGFVASHLKLALAEAFPRADQTLCPAPGGSFDITDFALVEQVVARVRPDVCVHLAAVSDVSAARRAPGHTWQVNLHGTLALARAILAHAPDCLMLFVSSAEIYGRSFRAGLPVDETAPAAPMNTYAATKSAADLALGAMVSDGLRVVRLRPFNHTGPGQSAGFAVPAFARQIARIKAGRQAPALNVGTLDSVRDFLNVRDVCAAYVACVTQVDRIEPGTILNIASGVRRRIGDVLQQMLEIAGVKASVATEAGLLRPSEIPIAYGDSSLAKMLLGWQPMIPWERTLADVLDDWTRRVGMEPS